MDALLPLGDFANWNTEQEVMLELPEHTHRNKHNTTNLANKQNMRKTGKNG